MSPNLKPKPILLLRNVQFCNCKRGTIAKSVSVTYKSLQNNLINVVVIQFLSGVVPLAEMAGFTPFPLQLLALRPSTCLVSGHPPSSNQSSLSPLPLASSRSSSVVLAFSCLPGSKLLFYRQVIENSYRQVLVKLMCL